MSKIYEYDYRSKDGKLLGTCRQNPQNIKFDPVSGGYIDTSVRACIDLSKEKNLPVRLVFNNIKLDITAQSDVQNIINAYHDALKKRTR